MAARLNVDEDKVIALCYRLWRWADRQCLIDDETFDAHANGLPIEWIDRHVRFDGFADALRTFNWLKAKKGGFILPKAGRWLGENAKKRALAATKKRIQRSVDVPDSVPEESGHDPGPAERRVEKRREAEKDHESDSDQYPGAKSPTVAKPREEPLSPKGARDSIPLPLSPPESLSRLRATVRFHDAIEPLFGVRGANRTPADSREYRADETTAKSLFANRIWPEDLDDDDCRSRFNTVMALVAKVRSRSRSFNRGPMAALMDKCNRLNIEVSTEIG